MSSFYVHTNNPLDVEELSMEDLTTGPVHGQMHSPWASYPSFDKQIAEEAEAAISALHVAEPIFDKKPVFQPMDRSAPDVEYIQLRETLHSKEKDLLALNNLLEQRDRSILEMRQQMREVEQERQATDERMLGIEKAWLTIQEQIDRLTQEKNLAVESENTWKNRMEDIQRKLLRNEQLLDASQALAAMEREQREMQLAQQQERMQGLLDEQAQQFQKKSIAFQDEIEALQQAMIAAEKQFRQQLADQLHHAEDQMRVTQYEHRQTIANLSDRYNRLLEERDEQQRAQQEQFDLQLRQAVKEMDDKHLSEITQLATTLSDLRQERDRLVAQANETSDELAKSQAQWNQLQSTCAQLQESLDKQIEKGQQLKAAFLPFVDILNG